MSTDYDDKVIALAQHLGIDPEEVIEQPWGHYDAQSGEFLVYTDPEADDAWDIALYQYLEECVYPELSGTLANYFDEQGWIRDARFDGRGHFLASYDGAEEEEQVNGEWYYIYRVN